MGAADTDDDEGDCGDENVGEDTYEDYVFEEEEESKDGIVEKSVAGFKKEIEPEVKLDLVKKETSSVDEKIISKDKKKKETEDKKLIDLKPCKKESSSFSNLFNMPSVSSLLPLSQSPSVTTSKPSVSHLSNYSVSPFSHGMGQGSPYMGNFHPVNMPTQSHHPMGFPSTSNFYNSNFHQQPHGMLSVPPASYSHVWGEQM